MNVAKLNGRPVMVGTKLEFLEEDRKGMWGDDYLIVTRVSDNGNIEYVGNGGEVDGQVRESELRFTFKHLEVVKSNENEYTLAAISDFLTIPNDKLDACFEELKLAIRSLRATMAATIAEYEELGGMKFTDQDKKVLWASMLPKLVWLDNGQNKTDVKMNGEQVMSVASK